ncbi:MutS protein msh4 [Pleurotus ostreatus]|uniref:DNA mismatch repair protein MSH3 n=1 Tax=Pleurotus ostreatus TaxID=5322 RepID=A0A0G2YLA9_PLEOS|nr:MutS protein homolog 4 [Pleurotus ostreatus]KAJ8703274.1 MutS protein msh4 [Pleurotus ostreatus]
MQASRPTTVSLSSFAYTTDHLQRFGTTSDPTRLQSSRPQTGRPLTGRPQTGRPQTGRPQTAVSIRHEGSYVIALIEGRGVAREVGLAALDKDTGKVVLVQLADCQTYVKTLHQMHLHTPSTILLPDTFISGAGPHGQPAPGASLLVEYIREEFPYVQLEPIGRKFWNEAGGLEFIGQLCVDDDERTATMLAVSTKYYALSATCALFKYAEIKMNARFASRSLRIRYVPIEGTLMIDPDTVRNLELVASLTHKKSTHSLFGVLNHTYTAMAARLLRANILSPVTVQDAINARLDFVEELICCEDKFTDIRDALKAFKKMDFDKLVASLAVSEARPVSTGKSAAARISHMLDLRTAIQSIPVLAQALSGGHCHLMQIMHHMLTDDRLAHIEGLVCSHLNDDTSLSKTGIAAVNARVYALKANKNHLLDVARETYKENVGDIYQLNRSLSEVHSLSLSLVYQETGFVFALKKDDLMGELPSGFINASIKRGSWYFSSMELKKMNARMKDALDETLLLSDRIIQELLDGILEDVGVLYKASEAIALIDMLWSFTHFSIIHNCVRPEFTGTLAVKSGRHPILQLVQPAGSLVANDIYCDDSSHFQIIQGLNMSGKSTYLQQVGLLVIVALNGCFIPAEYGSFRVHDCLLSRLSNNDDMEKSLSTFGSEMATSTMILGMSTSQSLVLVDELGRGTSPQEGVGIAHAIAEGLIKQKCLTFFTTHFSELAQTLSKAPGVVNLHLSVQKQPSSSFGLNFMYRITDGPLEKHEHYGLQLAMLADFPKDLIDKGSQVAQNLDELYSQSSDHSSSSKIIAQRQALLRLQIQLKQAFQHSSLPQEELVEYLRRFQVHLAKLFVM